MKRPTDRVSVKNLTECRDENVFTFETVINAKSKVLKDAGTAKGAEAVRVVPAALQGPVGYYQRADVSYSVPGELF